jgi:hypothetical protein
MNKMQQEKRPKSTVKVWISIDKNRCCQDSPQENKVPSEKSVAA